MRFSALIPAVLSAAALILTFLCLFAGSKQGFMEDYAIVTVSKKNPITTYPASESLTKIPPQLNTSRIGRNLLNTTSSESSNPIVSFFDDITNSVQEEINDQLNSFAKDLGLHDFYSAHLLNFCEGFYTPTDAPNATIPKSEISKNVTDCSNRTAMYSFNPRETLQRELDESEYGSKINLTELGWPESLDDAIQALEVATNAMFVLYCIGIAFAALALILALASLFTAPGGKLSACANVSVELIAFLAVGVASALATAIGVKAAEVVNDKGEDVGVSAQRGGKFMALTWVATACLLVASLVWCFDCFAGRKREAGRRGEKGGF